jgi:hypothetical protein
MKDRKLTMNIGIISFVLVFIILCLVTFSVLSLTSAQSNMEMTKRMIDHTTEYYQLSSQGEETLEKIDKFLYQLYQKSSSKNDYFQNLSQLKRQIPKITISNHTIKYDIINQDKKLHVQLKVLYPGNQFYRIEAWQIQSRQEWNPDQKMQIL